MDDLRKLDKKAQELFGRNKLWHPVRDPAACAEMDGEMRKRGYAVMLSYAHYCDMWSCLYIHRDIETPGREVFGEGKGKTECEARTRAAVRALEGSGEK